MYTLLGQLLLVLSVALVVAAEYEEFGCKFDDEYYNYRDGKEDFGEYVKTMKFANTREVWQFRSHLEYVRKNIRYKSFYNTVDPFFKMYNDYKDVKQRNPAYKFADFFPNYKPINPYENAQRFPNITIFSVISIYRAMKTEFGNKYPDFKDSFVLATCEEDIDRAVLDKVNSGMEQKGTPRGFVHDRIVGVIPFLILDDTQFGKNVRGFIIVESTHQTSSRTFIPIIMEREYANHTLNRNEVQLFGPRAATYTWLPNTFDSYIRIDYVHYVNTVHFDLNDTATVSLGDGEKLNIVPKEQVTRTDLLFMTPRSLCPFIKHVWKNNLLVSHVRLMKDTLEKGDGARSYIDFELKPLSGQDTFFTYRRTKEVPRQPYEPTLEIFRLDELNQMSQAFNNSLKNFATIFNLEYTQLYDILQQMSNIQHTDQDFLKQFDTYNSYKSRGSSTFWGKVKDTVEDLLWGK